MTMIQVSLCKYPGCKAPASKTWALIDLCSLHHEDIRQETLTYYRGQNYTYSERGHYLQIAPLIKVIYPLYKQVSKPPSGKTWKYKKFRGKKGNA